MKLKCLLAMLLLTFLSCSNTPAVEDKIDSLPHSEPGKTLIVYFSWSGHTQTVANIIHELIGCDMVEIEPEEPYSDEYNEVVDRFKNERDNHILPALRTKVENMDDYDTLIIGSPIWGGLLSSPVKVSCPVMICPGKRYSHSVHMEEAEQHKVWIISANYVPMLKYCCLWQSNCKLSE